MRRNRREFLKATAAVGIAGTAAKAAAQPRQSSQGPAVVDTIPWIGFLHSTALELDWEQGFLNGLRQANWEGDPTMPLGGRKQVIIRKIHGDGRYRSNNFDDLKRGSDDLKANTSANLKLLVAGGGLVSGLAAIQGTAKPMLVVLGRANQTVAQNPKTGGYFFDVPLGANSNQNLSNKISYLNVQYSIALNKMCLLYNGNSNMGAAELADWKSLNPTGLYSDASQSASQNVENKRIAINASIDAADGLLGGTGPRAIVLSGDPFFTTKRSRIIRHAQKKNGLVMCYPFAEYFDDAVDPEVDDRSFVMSYGPRLRNVYTDLGNMAGQFLSDNNIALSITQAQSNYNGLGS